MSSVADFKPFGKCDLCYRYHDLTCSCPEYAGGEGVGPPLNPSGLRPCGRAVLIKAHQPEMDKARERSALFIPTTVEESTAIWENRARVVAVGKCAWADEPEPRANPGDLVLVTKFAGFVKRGADGRLYRLINDRDIFCVIEKEAEESVAWDEPLISPPNRANSADFGDQK